jgi:hypothetical protein
VSVGEEKKVLALSIHLEIGIVMQLIKIEGYKILSTA